MKTQDELKLLLKVASVGIKTIKDFRLKEIESIPISELKTIKNEIDSLFRGDGFSIENLQGSLNQEWSKILEMPHIKAFHYFNLLTLGKGQQLSKEVQGQIQWHVHEFVSVVSEPPSFQAPEVFEDFYLPLQLYTMQINGTTGNLSIETWPVTNINKEKFGNIAMLRNEDIDLDILLSEVVLNSLNRMVINYQTGEPNGIKISLCDSCKYFFAHDATMQSSYLGTLCPQCLDSISSELESY